MTVLVSTVAVKTLVNRDSETWQKPLDVAPRSYVPVIPFEDDQE